MILLAASISAPVIWEIDHGLNTCIVQGVFHRALNCVDERNGLLTIATSVYGNGPFGVSVETADGFSFIDVGVKIGQQVQIDRNAIRIPLAPLEISLKHAVIWHCSPPVKIQSYQAIFDIGNNLQIAHKTAVNSQLESGLAPLLNHLDGILSGDLLENQKLPLLCRFSVKHLVGISRGIQHSDSKMLNKAVLPLIGLGCGLTPSGDDILMGVIGALSLFSDWQDIRRLCDGLSDVIASSVHGRTTFVSASYLEYAKKGFQSEALGDFLSSIVNGSGHKVFESSKRLLMFGHTSGHEIVLGSLLCLASIRCRYMGMQCNVRVASDSMSQSLLGCCLTVGSSRLEPWIITE